jgi:hypothetical protein
LRTCPSRAIIGGTHSLRPDHSQEEAQVRTTIWFTAGLVAASFSLAAAAQTLSVESIEEGLGLGAEDRAKLEAGEIVSAELEESSEKQLAVALALKVPATIDDIAESVTSGTNLQANSQIQASGRIDPAKLDQAFDGVTLEAAEVAKLLKVEPGSEFNLSADEIAVFQGLGQQYKAGDPAAADAVNAAYRQVLAGRTQAYLQHGLDGIAAYDRGDGETSSAADDLRSAAEASKLVEQAVPDLYQAFVSYPAQATEGVEQEFYWTKQAADDRPVYILTHRMLQHRPDALVLLSRDFYVGHSFNDSQAAAGALPVSDGVVIFYANRTASDQVAGFMSSMRHSVGRGMMRDSLVEAMEEIRATWQR